MADSRKYVISAPRSGLNWLRFCVESHCGQRTPGKTVLLNANTHPDAAFVRSHDPKGSLLADKAGSLAWSPIEPREAHDAIIALILRDPLELFVRMAGKQFSRFALFGRNLTFFSEAVSTKKQVFYYEEITSDPAAMWSLMRHLELVPQAGADENAFSAFKAHWADRRQKSWDLYDRNQSRGGGAQTKDANDVYRHHQSQLSLRQKQMVWAWLDEKLNDDERALLTNYRPTGPVGSPGTLARLRARSGLYR